MKKPKIKLDSAAMQAFLLNHVEKILLGVVLLLMLLLVYQGLSLKGLEGNQTPQGLVEQSTRARQHIDNPNRWEEIKETKLVAKNTAQNASISRTATRPEHYPLLNALKGPDFIKLSPRTDPQLFPPMNLVVHPVVGPLAGMWTDISVQGEDPLTKAAASPANRAPPKPVSTKKKAAPGADMLSPDGTVMPGPPKRGKRTKGPMGSQNYLDVDSADFATMDTSGGYGYGMEQMITTNIGFQPPNPDSTIALRTQAMVITAVVPYEKQVEEYLNTLGKALDYDPQRDFPQYINFGVQRFDVTDDPDADLDTLKPTTLDVNATLMQQVFGNPYTRPPRPPLWAGAPTEVVDPNYLDSVLNGGKLTHPAPPFLMRDLWPLLTHPDIPLATQDYGYAGDLSGMAMPGGVMPGDDSPVGPFGPPGGFGGGAPGMMGAEGGFGAPGAFQFQPQVGGAMYGPDSAGSGSAGRPMIGGVDANGSPLMAQAKYKLVRFTDTTVEMGRKYRYRLKVFLMDPNHPPMPDPVRQIQGYAPPSVASLHEDVQKRVKELDAADQKRGQGYRTWWIESPWSEPSPVVELSSPTRILASKVVPPPAPRLFANRADVVLPTDEPKATVVAVSFDPATVADIPAELDKVYRGSVFDFVQDSVKVVHPVTRQVVELNKQPIRAGALVADMHGGEKIPAVTRVADQALIAPGEVLVFDALGKLHVQDEVLDVDAIRQATIPKTDAAGQPLDGAMPGGLPGDMLSPGPGGRGSRGGVPVCY
jgi:hypothetical protein